MREMESRSQLVVAADEMGFTEGVESELQFRGLSPEIARQNGSQRRSSRDEAIAVGVKAKARRPDPLVIGEDFPSVAQTQSLEIDLPDVDFVWPDDRRCGASSPRPGHAAELKQRRPGLSG